MTQQIIEHLQLSPHPEGGYFRRVYTSPLLLKKNSSQQHIGSAIYYYLGGNDFSAWHRIGCDEMWHFYAGSPLKIYLINNAHLVSIYLGNPVEDLSCVPQYLIPANTWFAAEVVNKNAFALVGCSCFPEFEFKDFEMGKRKDLLQQFPEYAELINQFTRE